MTKNNKVTKKTVKKPVKKTAKKKHYLYWVFVEGGPCGNRWSSDGCEDTYEDALREGTELAIQQVQSYRSKYPDAKYTLYIAHTHLDHNYAEDHKELEKISTKIPINTRCIPETKVEVAPRSCKEKLLESLERLYKRNTYLQSSINTYTAEMLANSITIVELQEMRAGLEREKKNADDTNQS